MAGLPRVGDGRVVDGHGAGLSFVPWGVCDETREAYREETSLPRQGRKRLRGAAAEAGRRGAEEQRSRLRARGI